MNGWNGVKYIPDKNINNKKTNFNFISFFRILMICFNIKKYKVLQINI